MNRRTLLRSGFALPLLAAPGTLRAQSWPDRPIRLVVPFAAGTSTDIIGRMIGGQISRGLGGHAVVVDNRAGAGGTIGSAAVAQAPADGHTILLGTIGTHAVNPNLMRNLAYNPVRDFTPLFLHSKTALLLVVRPQLGVRSMAEFVALARARPLSVGTSGVGTAGHLNHAVMSEATGTTTTHVPYSDGARAMTDALSGTLDALFYHTQFVRAQIGAGQLVGLGITGAQRSPLLPAVPTFAEQGLAGIDAEGWWAMFGPANLPVPVTQRLSGILAASLNEAETRTTLERNGVEAIGGGPEALARYQREELERWGAVIRRANITVDS
ncbi:Bug family tripartite tricarboxylate transporter substrate binding protein [Falsiroseomonas stagni]|uniref:Tripartite-type tricarboxylate transporter, receptor component TctC n=1 Tax=Falsiroseomonas stagni DSM 19981 TaxID=1123062 RepID=A0A1I4AZ94_9PROT|nr:tripartite tricarboxylate transporter substrate binding protein [Falsiroseomonas stagni]SFK61227.1 Tripartite-type tricarboxylate transporter, receptor component TctC [Falsiroseomonas stagni DSM 19981]